MALWGRVFQRLLYALYRQRIPLLLVLVIAAGTGTYYVWLNQSNLPNEAAAAGSQPIEVTVMDLQGDRSSNAAILTLKEKNGNRRISMAVGMTEALAIAQKRGQQTGATPDQLPQAYGLMRDTIQQLGGRVDRVLVNDATQREYLAQIVVSDANGGDVKVIKARPGDAIALALQTNAPIFVENQVLDRFGTKGSG